MEIKKHLLAVATLLLASVSAVTAQQMPPIPVDPEVRIGQLPNQLTYYIRHNAWPEQRAEFYIAQRVGSIQENDDQRGLAHFLEHMCFNGTKHFPGNDIVKWCETIGVKFGRDLNAYTSIDQTVYNISNVPTTRDGIVDSCLLILSDWADGLLLEPEEIDKERGVIHEEWRLRTSAPMRMFTRDLPDLYPGSKYGHRMPIGLMEIVDNFKPEVLRAYYEKWYRPDNQAIIVVGDVDVDRVEQKIKELFGSIAMPENAAPVVAEEVPDNSEAIIVIDKDKEMPYTALDLILKSDPIPTEIKGNFQYLVINYVKDAAIGMLNSRLGELAQKGDCPFLKAESRYGQYLLSKTKDGFDLDVMPKEGQTEQALRTVFVEARRAAQFGFTATEYQRYKQKFLSELEKDFLNKDKRYNSDFCRKYVDHFLDNEPIPALDDYYQVMKQLVPMLPVDAVNGLMAQFVTPSDSNLVVLCMTQERDGAVYPTREGLKQALDEARQTEIQAYVDNVKDEPLISQLPKAGKIVKETDGKKFGYKELTLSNGAKVVLKHTDLKTDEVILRAEAPGGMSLYGPADFANAKLFDDAIEASGLGNFSHSELEKALAGKIAEMSLTLDGERQQLSGSSTPGDVETMLQLLYLSFTHIAKDQESFDNLVKTQELMLRNKALQPEAAFSDSLTLTLQRHDPRHAPLTAADLSQASYDRILEMARERTANAADYIFTIVGNFDEQAIRPLIEQYIASLPGQPKKLTKAKDLNSHFTGVVKNHFTRQMETPKAIAVVVWTAYDQPYTLRDIVRADVMGQILMMTYTETIREEASAAYSVFAQGVMRRETFHTGTTVLVYCPMKPEKGDIATKIILDEAGKMATTVSPEKLQKVKEYLLKHIDDRAKENEFWSETISNLRKWNVDTYTDYKAVVESLTPQDIADFAARLLKAGNRAEVIMMPAE